MSQTHPPVISNNSKEIDPYVKKDIRIKIKRDQCVCLNKPFYMKKDTGTRQKSYLQMSKETYIHVKRDLYVCQKRPIYTRQDPDEATCD